MKKIACLVLLVVSILFSVAGAEMLIPGDIVVYGQQAVSPDGDDELYSFQTMLAYYENMGKKVGIYDSLFGIGGLKTWDDTNYPMGQRFFWDHVEIVTSATSTEAIKREGSVIVVLRPLQRNPDFYINISATIERAEEMKNNGGAYNIPIHVADLHKILRDGMQWIADQPELFDHWSIMGGVDFSNIQLPSVVQYSPYVHGPDNIDTGHTDIKSPLFTKRDRGCSTITMWSLIHGWYHGGGGERTRQLFLNNLANVNAIDAMAPGQVAWWLVNNGLVSIILPS